MARVGSVAAVTAAIVDGHMGVDNETRRRLILPQFDSGRVIIPSKVQHAAVGGFEIDSRRRGNGGGAQIARDRYIAARRNGGRRHGPIQTDRRSVQEGGTGGVAQVGGSGLSVVEHGVVGGGSYTEPGDSTPGSDVALGSD